MLQCSDCVTVIKEHFVGPLTGVMRGVERGRETMRAKIKMYTHVILPHSFLFTHHSHSIFSSLLTISIPNLSCCLFHSTSLIMSNDDMSQQLRHGNDSYYFHVYPGIEETQGVPFVLLKDIHALFPNASNFMCGRHVISFMRDANYDR